MTIELFYFDGCPCYLRALDHLKEALQLEAPEAPDVDMVAVTSDADAQAKRLIGSPTIRIDGVDIEGPDADKHGYALGCRVYSDEGRMAGWPSVMQIRHALKAARKHSEGERT